MPINIEELESAGCTLVLAASEETVLQRILALREDIEVAGERLSLAGDVAREALAVVSPVVREVQPEFRAVRAVYFDKSAARNWLVPWHQDRTIAVRSRVDVPGYGPWSLKAGVLHVEPPFELLAGMITARLHLDDCPETNAPLTVAIGSHQQRVAAKAAAGHAQACEQRECIARAGDIWLYRTPILHRSARSTVPSRRRVVQIDFSASTLPDGLDWAT